MKKENIWTRVANGLSLKHWHPDDAVFHGRMKSAHTDVNRIASSGWDPTRQAMPVKGSYSIFSFAHHSPTLRQNGSMPSGSRCGSVLLMEDRTIILILQNSGILAKANEYLSLKHWHPDDAVFHGRMKSALADFIRGWSH